MNHHTTTRIPVNDEYAAHLGKAVYVFAYYEWTIIYIIDYLKNGFVSEYSRGKHPKTSGVVAQDLKSAIDKNSISSLSISKSDLETCHQKFSVLKDKRNALIHAHPITDKDGSQILSYQTNSSKAISDIKWPQEEIKHLIQEIDKEAVKAGDILDKIRKDLER